MTTPSSHLNALIVGAAAPASTYAEALARLPGIDLVAFCARAGDAARAFGRRYPGEHYESISDALERTAFDIALVCTPPDERAGSVHALVESRRVAGILCATPPALSATDVERMGSYADHVGVALMFGFPLRYSPAVLWVRRLLDMGTLGGIKRMSVESSRHSGTPSSGGPGFRLLPPALDLALHLAKDLRPFAVTASTSRRTLEAEACLGTIFPADCDTEESISGTLLLRDDDRSVQLAFASDVNAHHPEGDRVTVEVQCTEGSARLELVQDRNRAGEVLSETLVPRVQCVVEGQPVVLVPTGVPGFPTVADCQVLELVDLVDTVRTRRSWQSHLRSPVFDSVAYSVMCVVEAAYQSDNAGAVQVDVRGAS